MIDVFEGRTFRVVIALAALFTMTVAMLSADTAEARIKPRDGLYYQKPSGTQLTGYVTFSQGKIISMGGNHELQKQVRQEVQAKGPVRH